MTTLYLVRHGIKVKEIGDVPLSANGLEQAKLTASLLEDKSIKHVYASPLRRAKETAQCIASPHALPVLEDDRLRERANWGDLAGQTFQEFVDMWNRCSRDREYVPPVGDSAQRAGERLDAFAKEVSKVHANDEIVAVTHGGIITDFMINCLSLDELNQLHPRFLEMQSQLIPECSITVIQVNDRGYQLQRFADVRHL